MDLDHVSTCFWSREGFCRHPRIGNQEATPERCGPCGHFKPRTLVQVGNLPEPPRRSLLSRTASYLKAEVSLIAKGPVPNEEFVRRLETCNACPNLNRSEDPVQLGWCSKCGCGDRARAELTIKGRMPASSCPYHLWIKDDAPRAPLPDTLRGAIHA